MNDELLNALCNLGFSQMEAKVYTALVPEEKLGGYQIAKKIGVSRPSVYSALDHLLENGYITSIPGESSEYSAVNPDVLMEELKKKFSSNADQAKNALSIIASPRKDSERFINITGKSNLIDSVNRLIYTAKKEIVFNSSMDLEPFRTALNAASNRGVRIILFSWQNINTYDIPLEFYCGYTGENVCSDKRIFMVVDARNCVIGSNDRTGYTPHKTISDESILPDSEKDFLGMTSTNQLVVNIVMEHIHFDIYLQRLKTKYGQSLIDTDIQIGTIMEQGFNEDKQ